MKILKIIGWIWFAAFILCAAFLLLFHSFNPPDAPRYANVLISIQSFHRELIFIKWLLVSLGGFIVAFCGLIVAMLAHLVEKKNL